MLNKLKQLREANEEGFTLIELLVVIVIIGILAAIALPIFLNQQKAASAAAVKSDIKNAALAIQTFYTLNNKYPVSNADFAASNIVVGEKGNYKTGNNFLICTSNAPANAGYAIFAASNSDEAFYYSSRTGRFQPETTLDWPQGMAVTCPVAGFASTGTGQFAAWGNGGSSWASWVK